MYRSRIRHSLRERPESVANMIAAFEMTIVPMIMSNGPLSMKETNVI